MAAKYANYMRIPRLDSLPDIAQRSEWAKLLEVDHSTLYRAEMRGDLEGFRPTGRSVVYTKDAILSWIGIKRESVK